MRIDFVLTDENGKTYSGAATLVAGPQAAPAKATPAPPVLKEQTSLPEHIIGLREAGFFNHARTGQEVHAALQEKYACQADRVQMALLRLQRKKSLRKTKKSTEGREQVAYVW